MSTTLAPWDRTRFEALKQSIADEADVRARLATWDADLIANTKALAEARLALSQATQARDTKYRSLRSLLAKESGESIKSHLGELFHLDDEILSANRRIKESSSNTSQHDRDNLERRLGVINRVREEMIDISPIRRQIRDQQSEIREFSENGNAAKRLLSQIESANKSPYDNRHELVEHYTYLLERHQRKLAEMQRNLQGLLERVFS